MPDSNWLFRITGPAHRLQCLQGPGFWSQWSESNAHRLLTVQLLSLSYIGWSRRGYSKPRPPRYECGALPLELLRHGASAENRTPLIGQAIRCPANGPRPRNYGADGDNRNLFSGLEAQGTPYIPRPPASHFLWCSFSCQRAAFKHTCSASPPSGNKLDKTPQITGPKYKRGGHFWWPPLLETGMLFQDGQVTARAS